MLIPSDLEATEKRQEVRQHVRGYLKQHRLSGKKVAKAIGVSETVISQVLNGVYPTDDVEHLVALNNWMELDSQRREVRKPPNFVTTSVAEQIIDCVRTVEKIGKIGVLYGPAGIGKSMTLRACLPEFPAAVYIEMTESDTTPRSFLVLLAKQLRVASDKSNRSQQTLFHHCCEILADSGRLILIDEAHYLKGRALNVIRDLHKHTNCPMILCGTVDLEAGAVRDAMPDRGQWASLVLVRRDLAESAKQDGGGTPLFSIDDIRKVFARAQIRLTPAAENTAWQMANILGLGGLRLVMALATLALADARIRGQDRVDADDLWSAFESLRTRAETVNLKRLLAQAA